MNVVDQFYDLIDECCMLLNEKLHLNYFDSLIRVSNDILYGVDVSRLEEDDIEKLKSAYNKLDNIEITNEEVRLSMQLLIIKAMKHINMNLEIMTPDYINYIIAYLVNSYFKDKKMINILDVEVGTGNLINSVSNFIQCESNLFGVENNKLLIDICKANSNLQNNDINLYYQDTLMPLMEKVDVVIGDLECKDTEDGKYYPYQILLNYLKNIEDNGIFIYLIENDFFNNKDLQSFKKDFYGTLLGLIVLPQNLFHEGHIGKSLLIGTNKYISSFEMMIMQLSDINNKDKFYKDLQEIQEWINKIKEIEK